MAVQSETSKISYNGNGVTTTFAVPFRFLLISDLAVTLRNANGTETAQVLTTNYTVTGARLNAGGTLTMNVAPPTGSKLFITRSVPETQLIDYRANDPFPEESAEDGIDKLTMIVQQIREILTRVFTLPVTTDISSYITNLTGGLTLPALIAGYFLHVNVTTGLIEWASSTFSPFRKVTTLTPVAGVLTIDCSLPLGEVLQVTLTANITSIVKTNLPAAGSCVEFTLEFVQGGAGSYTVTWPGSTKHSGGPPVLSTAVGAEDHIGCRVYASGAMRTYPALAMS